MNATGGGAEKKRKRPASCEANLHRARISCLDLQVGDHVGLSALELGVVGLVELLLLKALPLEALALPGRKNLTAFEARLRRQVALVLWR
jgi:hypothetical protein